MNCKLVNWPLKNSKSPYTITTSDNTKNSAISQRMQAIRQPWTGHLQCRIGTCPWSSTEAPNGHESSAAALPPLLADSPDGSRIGPLAAMQPRVRCSTPLPTLASRSLTEPTTSKCSASKTRQTHESNGRGWVAANPERWRPTNINPWNSWRDPGTKP